MYKENSSGERPCRRSHATRKAYSITHFPHVHFTAHIHLHCFQEGSNPATNPHSFQTNSSFLLVHPAANIPLFNSVFICPNSTRVSSWSLHPLPHLNPPCFSATRFLPSATCANLPWMMLHIALFATETNDIPWNSSILHTLPPLFFGMGTTILFHHSEGTIPYVHTN